MSGGTLRLAGGHVVTPNGTVDVIDVTIADGTIVSVGDDVAAPTRIVDVSNMYVAPGFIDLQLNGGWGHDFTSDPASIGDVARRLPATGVTAFLPTIVTAPPEARRRALDTMAMIEDSESPSCSSAPSSVRA